MADSTGRALSAGSSESPSLGNAEFDWLARAQAEPQQAHKEWMETGIALLPLGKRFNSILLPAALVHIAAGTSDLETVTRTLAELLGGPVIHNRPQQQFYALVEPAPAPPWTQEYPEAPMLGAGQFLSVPAPDLTGPTGLYWPVRPRTVGDLCPAQSVAALVRIARSEAQRGRR